MGDGLICAIFLHNANNSRGSGCPSSTLIYPLIYPPDNFPSTCRSSFCIEGVTQGRGCYETRPRQLEQLNGESASNGSRFAIFRALLS
jgi:hypothetical protein